MNCSSSRTLIQGMPHLAAILQLVLTQVLPASQARIQPVGLNLNKETSRIVVRYANPLTTCHQCCIANLHFRVHPDAKGLKSGMPSGCDPPTGHSLTQVYNRRRRKVARNIAETLHGRP